MPRARKAAAPVATPRISRTIAKKTVAQMAAKLCAEHGWCDEVNDALRSIGIEPVKMPTVVVTLEVPLDKLLAIAGDSSFDSFLSTNNSRWKLNYLGSTLQEFSTSEAETVPVTYTLKENS